MIKALVSLLSLVCLCLPGLASAKMLSTSSETALAQCQILGLGTREEAERPQGQNRANSAHLPSGFNPRNDGGGDLLPIPWGNELPLPPSEIAEAIRGKWIITQPKCGTYLTIEVGVSEEGTHIFYLTEVHTETNTLLSTGYGMLHGGALQFWIYSSLLDELFHIQISVFNKEQFPRSHWDKDYFWCDRTDKVFILRFIGPNSAGSFTLKRP